VARVTIASAPAGPGAGPRRDRTKGPLCRAHGPQAATTPIAGPGRGGTPVDQGLAPTGSSVSRLRGIGDRIGRSVAEMCEAGEPPRCVPGPPRLPRSSAIRGRNASAPSIARRRSTTTRSAPGGRRVRRVAGKARRFALSPRAILV